MSANEIITEFDKLSAREQEEVFALIAGKFVAKQAPNSNPWLGKKLSFDEACEIVFCENRELFALLAK
jgi:hypothetical protein